MSGHTPGPWWISHATTVEGHPMVVAGHGHDHGLVAEVLTAEDAKLIASLPALVAERDALHERVNCLEDELGDVLAYLEGEPGYENAKPAIIDNIKALFGARAALSPEHQREEAK